MACRSQGLGGRESETLLDPPGSLHAQRSAGVLAGTAMRRLDGYLPVNIVQLTTFDAGGSAWHLHRAIDETTPHASALFRRDDNWLRYPTQHSFADRRLLGQVLDEADVVHVHLESSWLLQVRADVRKVIHHHGMGYRLQRTPCDLLDRRAGAIRLAPNLELLGYGADLQYLPNAVPFDELNASARGRSRGKLFRLAHSPTRREAKGTELVVRTVAELAAEGVPSELVLIEGRLWSEGLRIRASCDATFDSFWLGMQNSGCEAACMNQPVVAGDVHVAREHGCRFGYVAYTFAESSTLE